jgi:pimeloyl-ACP methyl ester carboxylesterase
LLARATPLLAQKPRPASAVTVNGSGAETYVLVAGLAGGVAGFRRLEARLVENGKRVVVIDPFALSVDSSDVTFSAIARRVDGVLAELGITSTSIVAHSHGAGVALRLAALAPKRVSALYLIDAGAIAGTRTPVLSSSLRLVPLIARIPHGREFIRRRYLRGLRENSGRHEWLDAETERAYTQPMLDDIGRVIAFALRLGRADQPDSLAGIIARISAPITVILGDVPHPSAPGAEELDALAPLGAQLRIEHLAGVGHFPHEEAPDDVARIIIAPRLALANAADTRR